MIDRRNMIEILRDVLKMAAVIYRSGDPRKIAECRSVIDTFITRTYNDIYKK